MAAPTVRDSIAHTANASTTLVATKPVGTASGDLLIALFDAISTTSNLAALTLPSGWTQLRRDDQTSGGLFFSHLVAYKTAGGSEAATYTFTAPSSAYWRFVILAAAGATAIEATARTFTASATATQIPCPSVTTLGADRLLLYYAGLYTNGDNSHVPPAGWTEVEDFKNTAIGNGSVSVGWNTQAVAGATGTFIVTATSGAAAINEFGYTLAVSPSAATATFVPQIVIT